MPRKKPPYLKAVRGKNGEVVLVKTFHMRRKEHIPPQPNTRDPDFVRAHGTAEKMGIHV